MLPTNISNSGSGSQNTVLGSGDQYNQNGNSSLYNGSTVYNYSSGVQDPQVEKAKQLQNEKEDCLRSLTFHAIHARRQDITPAEHGTCDWLFATPDFCEWRQPTRLPTHNGVLWIKGKPGAGKSTLMKHIFVRCQEDFFCDYVIAAYFFNARGEALEKSPLGMLRSIVYQLIEQDGTLYERFVTYFREKQRTGWEGDRQWRKSELQEFIRSVAAPPRSRPLLLFVDALDECDDSEVRDVVGFLESLSKSAARDAPKKVPLKICLSSRHYPSISINKVLELVVETSTDHQADIATYIAGRLRVRETDIEAEIKERADGIFLWVVLVVALLNKAYDEGRVEAMRQTLKEIPDDLETIFSTILGEDISGLAETVRMLQWVLFSGRPLEPQELFAAVVGTALPSSDLIQRRITTSSKGLIEVRKGDAESVQFIHLSVNDFLFRQKRLQKLDPTLGPEPVMASHGRLWARCWSCIMHVDTTITNPLNMIGLKDKNPFLGYAASHIFYHAERALSRNAVMHSNIQLGGDDVHNASDACDPLFSQQWPQEPNCWFQWWKTFLFSAGSYEEQEELRTDLDAGLIYILARRKLPNLLRATLRGGADIHAQGGYFGNALQAASVGGNAEIVQMLLDKGADVHAQGGYYCNALQAASAGRNAEIVQILLDKGANVHAQGGEYNNALQAALTKKNAKIVQMLLNKGANVHAQSGNYGNALQIASAGGNTKIVQMLLDKGADVHAQGGYCGNALQAASIGGNAEIVQMLLDKGADVHAQGGYYGNALQAASAGGNAEIVQMLLDKGADIHAQGGDYGNALQAASAGRNAKIVQMLLNKGADVHAQGSEYGNALQAASAEGNAKIVQMLLDKGADVHAQGGYYGNALQAASAKGNAEIVQMLLDKGADVHAQGGEYDNALQAAIANNHNVIARLLCENDSTLRKDKKTSLVPSPYEKALLWATELTTSLHPAPVYWGLPIILASWLIFHLVRSNEWRAGK